MQQEYDKDIEDRITMEIVVDAYGAEERAIGWHCYLEDKLNFPFAARCRQSAAKSPLKEGSFHRVVRMADEEECDKEIYVMVDYGGDELAVGLSQLIPVGEKEELDEFEDETLEGVEDWHYWVDQGYRF